MYTEETITEKWQKVKMFIETVFHKTPDLNAILFIIGLREYGKPRTKFSKEEKVQLMHIANCKVLSYSGHYELVGIDQNDWPVWELRQQLPQQNIFEQEIYLRSHIVTYFEEEGLIES
jgi:sensor domain CHASE-containing protein